MIASLIFGRRFRCRQTRRVLTRASPRSGFALRLNLTACLHTSSLSKSETPYARSESGGRIEEGLSPASLEGEVESSFHALSASLCRSFDARECIPVAGH